MRGVLAAPAVRGILEDTTAELERERRVGGGADVRHTVDSGLDLAQRQVPVEVERQRRHVREVDERHAVKKAADPRTGSNHRLGELLHLGPVVGRVGYLVVAYAARTVHQNHEIHRAVICNETAHYSVETTDDKQPSFASSPASLSSSSSSHLFAQVKENIPYKTQSMS